MMFKLTVDYSAGTYGDIHETFERHEEMVRGVAALVEVSDLHCGRREYVVEVLSEDGPDGWDARGLADELVREVEADGWPTEMKRLSR